MKVAGSKLILYAEFKFLFSQGKKERIWGIFNIYLPAVEGRDWVVRDKTYDMQPTVKITSKLEDVA